MKRREYTRIENREEKRKKERKKDIGRLQLRSLTSGCWGLVEGGE